MFAKSPDDRSIAFEVIGEGPPLVLLHGFTETRQSWVEFGYVERLCSAGRRLVLIDARGHGLSEKPHAAKDYGPSRRAADVVAVLDALGIEAADLMGYSMGGLVALAVALGYPARARTLVTIAAHPFAEDLSPFRDALRLGMEPWLAWIETEAGAVSEAMRCRIGANDLRALRACVAEDRPDASTTLAGLETPTLAIAGTLDPAFIQVRRFAGLAGGGFLALPGRNHFTSFLAVDEIVGAASAFLGEATPSAAQTA